MQKVNESESLMRYRNIEDDVKTELKTWRGISQRETCLLRWRHPIQRVARFAWRLLQGTWEPVVGMQREKFKQRTCKNESTNALHRDRLICSSDETSVMEVERRGQLIQRMNLNN
jgi:hypothetical protein